MAATKYSTADVILAAHLAGAGKSAAEIATALRFTSVRATYTLLHRYGISLVQKYRGQACTAPLALSEEALEYGIRLAANQGSDPALAFALVLEEAILSPNTFKDLLTAAEKRRK
jgi:hypothetical protein